MKKRIVTLAAASMALVLGAALMVGCSSNSAQSSSKASVSSSSSSAAVAVDESANIETLIVGFDNSYPPYGFIGDNGAYTGLDLDLATEVAKRNNWQIELKPIDWDSKDAELGTGNINCIWNGFTIEGRESDYTFSDPYMLNQQVIVVKSDSGIANEGDLAGKVVITQAGGASDELFTGEDAEKADLAATFSRLDTIADYNNAFMQLDAGTVDAVACDLSIAAYQMSANPDKYTQLSEPLSSEHYGVGFKLGSQALADKVNETLKAMVADGTAKTICDKYAEYGVDYDANWVLK